MSNTFTHSSLKRQLFSVINIHLVRFFMETQNGDVVYLKRDPLEVSI